MLKQTHLVDIWREMLACQLFVSSAFIDRTKRLYQLLVNLASLTGQKVMTSWKSNKLNLDYKVCVYKGNKCGNLLGGTSV